MKTLISIVGPTAVGKSALAIELAIAFQSEIISADSRQFYKEMCIGTAKPSLQELNSVPHHFINSHMVHETFSAGDFEKEGLQRIETLFKKHETLILVGGSGLFVKAITEGMDALPKAKEGVRESLNQLYQEKGLTFIREWLKNIDPNYYAEVDINNPQRMIRAIEVFESTKIPFSVWRRKNIKARPFQTISIGLTMERALLYERINHRVDIMLKNGLINEVESLYPLRHLPALQTVGYVELFDFFDKKISLEESIAKIKQHSRKYAKRQLTWFKKNDKTHWFNSSDSSPILHYLKSIL